MSVALLLAVLAGVAVGLSLGALGGGGSILAVPALVYVLSLDPRAATTASLVVVGATALTGAVGHARAGRVDWRAALVVAALGVPAALAGSVVGRLVDPQALLVAFAGLMVLAAVAMFRRSRGEVAAAAPAPRTGARRVVPVVAVGLGVGFLTGFLGVGGGFLVVPALVLALGFAMPTAVGTSLVVIALTSLAAFAERVGHGAVPWGVVVPFAVAAAGGSLLGRHVTDRVPAVVLTRAFAVLLLLVGGYVAVRAGTRLQAA
ncbi:sulfite exporter TauE/SafE family protein [Phycicoccus sonneratiae]|uniref:Probable membrane transporter protein n=1 Tax=Phycicoccus sonneratiae TaxID=2807628 RepID=A0ABS2CHR5_9MICO|nr:sulfite exporter TauE/SafE family protein [Phycicoccus sonneraticus]MBM6399325.1 sulfite exporter TauE/SafE family protein [Phycicoccus sonneraticus]